MRDHAVHIYVCDWLVYASLNLEAKHVLPQPDTLSFAGSLNIESPEMTRLGRVGVLHILVGDILGAYLCMWALTDYGRYS
jgi:hypothetical protein